MKNRKILFLVIGTVFCSMLAFAALATTTDYQTTNDPLITLSYLNETLIPQIEKNVTEKVIASLGDGKINIETGTATEPENPLENVDMSTFKYTVVHLTKGQKLFAMGESTESLEVILRSGVAAAISPFADQGIADLTASKQLYNGDEFVRNNYCIVPRGQDGRGVEILSDEAYFLVRGVYEVE